MLSVGILDDCWHSFPDCLALTTPIVKLKAIIVIAVLVVLIMGLLLRAKVANQVKKMKTLDNMGQIYVALSRTLEAKPLEEYDPVAETRKLFPTLPVTRGQIADAWGNPIGIVIKRVEKGFDVRLVSAGADGLPGTSDDIVQQYLLTDQKW
jgi:hypothetical protein